MSKGIGPLIAILLTVAMLSGHANAQVVETVPPSTLPVDSAALAEADRLNTLVVELYGQGKYPEAIRIAKQVLAIREANLGSDHPDTGLSVYNLAALYEELGQYTSAETFYLRALAITESTQGPEHPDTGALLNSLAWLYRVIGKLANAEPLYVRALAISEKAKGPEHPDTGGPLNNLADLYRAMGQYDKAEPILVRALLIVEGASGAEHPDTSTILDNLAGLYLQMGLYDRAEPLYLRSLSIAEKTEGPEHPSMAISLNNLAELYRAMGQYARAEPLLLRALAIAEQAQGPEHPFISAYVNNLALLYRATGQYMRAEPFLIRALAITEKTKGQGHPDTGKHLNNLGQLYQDVGQYAQAEPLLVRALAIAEKALGPEHPDTSERLNTLALMYRSMGQYARAEPLFVRALNIAERAKGSEHPHTATVLNNLALVYGTMGQFDRAEPLYHRALAIALKAKGPEHDETAVSLNNLADLFRAMGLYGRAEPLMKRALVIAEKVLGPEHPATAISLHNLAGIYIATGQYNEAEPLNLRAYHIAQHAGDPQLLRHVQMGLSVLLFKQSNPEAAIFFGKQAVNTLQGLRANVAGLGKNTLKDFDSSIESTYRHLSRLLIAQGRLIEAERVLELLKEQEQFQFVRRDATVSDLTGKAPLTAFETTQAQVLDNSGAPLAGLYRQLTALEDQPQRTAEQDAELTTLRAQLDNASQAFQKVLTQVIAALGAPRQDKIDDLKEAQGLQDTLRELSELSGEPVAMLYTVADKDAYSLILTTADYRRAYTVPVGAADLNQKIAAWRDSLKNPRLDPRPQAKALLDIVLPPAARAELAQLKAGSLMWHLDGALRLLPLAALHDGEHYLIERYRLATYTSASRDRLKDNPKAQWQGLGLGVSEVRTVGDKSFAALTSVPQELATVIRQGQGQEMEQGVIPGQRYLNPEFNWDTLQAQLKRKGKYPLVHIASHFSLEPGNDTMSYLLPGAGEPITLALLTRQDNLFGGVDLLTLSACETGVGGGRGNDGVEVDGLSFITQRQGAKAVLASLWPVADESTAKLMQRFYQLKQDKQLSKAEALRQAQMEFIRTGQASQTGQGDDRGAARVRVDGQAGQPADTDLGWAHPYYWAPFVLMGNWL